MEEIWRDIPGYEGYYQASSEGRIRNRYGRVLRPKISRKHLWVCLCVRQNKRYAFVHRLVLLAFVGACPVGMEVCHNDSNPINNRLSNLRYDTSSGNKKDAMRVGNFGKQKLSVQNVLELREKYGAEKRLKNVPGIARAYGVSECAIRDAIRGRTFAWLD